MGIAGNEWGFQVGTLPKGALDKISDVPGVTVGHCTLADGMGQTGVTAHLPQPDGTSEKPRLKRCNTEKSPASECGAFALLNSGGGSFWWACGGSSWRTAATARRSGRRSG